MDSNFAVSFQYRYTGTTAWTAFNGAPIWLNMGGSDCTTPINDYDSVDVQIILTPLGSQAVGAQSFTLTMSGTD